MSNRHLIIILLINAIALAVIGNRGPTNTREMLGLFAMANIADNQQVVLPEAFGAYSEAIEIDKGKYLAPQPLLQQVGGSISYKLARVFFGVDQDWEGLQKFYRIASYLGNLFASTILIILFSKALSVKGIRGKNALLLLIPLAFFSLVFTAGMILQVHLFVAALCFWALHCVNNGVYLLNRDLPYRKAFMFAGGLLSFAACLSFPVIGLAAGFLVIFLTQKDLKFNRVALDIILGAIGPIIVTVVFMTIYSRQVGIFIPPWPEAATVSDSMPADVMKFFYNSTIGLNGFFIYSPLATLGIISLLKRLNHFQNLTQRRKNLDRYAKGQYLIASSVYWGGILSLVFFWLETLINGVQPPFSMEHLQRAVIKLGGDEIALESMLRPYGTMSLLFLLPVLHYFNLHIFKEKPFKNFKMFYHEVVRVGALIAVIGLGSPTGGYLVPFIWSLNQIAMTVTNYFPQGTLLW